MMLSIGHDNYVNASDVVTIIRSDSSPARKLRKDAQDDGRLIVASGGRQGRSLVVMRSGHVIISCAHSRTLAERLKIGGK
jgi:regulator of extracellular matrix RemA (YlzA/DUF370 family)